MSAHLDGSEDRTLHSTEAPGSQFALGRVWLGLIILAAIFGGAISFVVGAITPPKYLGQVTILVSPATTEAITFSDVEVAQALAPTFAELSTTTPLLKRVIAATNATTDVASLARSIETHVPAGTSLITISVSDRDAAMAAALANEIASELASFEDQSGTSTSLRVRLSVVDPATPAGTPEGLGTIPRVGLGAAIGFFLALSFAFLVDNIGRGARSFGRDRMFARPSREASRAALVGPEAPSTYRADPRAARTGRQPSWPSEPAAVRQEQLVARHDPAAFGRAFGQPQAAPSGSGLVADGTPGLRPTIRPGTGFGQDPLVSATSRDGNAAGADRRPGQTPVAPRPVWAQPRVESTAPRTAPSGQPAWPAPSDRGRDETLLGTLAASRPRLDTADGPPRPAMAAMAGGASSSTPAPAGPATGASPAPRPGVPTAAPMPATAAGSASAGPATMSGATAVPGTMPGPGLGTPSGAAADAEPESTAGHLESSASASATPTAPSSPSPTAQSSTSRARTRARPVKSRAKGPESSAASGESAEPAPDGTSNTGTAGRPDAARGQPPRSGSRRSTTSKSRPQTRQ